MDIDKLRELFEKWWEEEASVPKMIDPPARKFVRDSLYRDIFLNKEKED